MMMNSRPILKNTNLFYIICVIVTLVISLLSYFKAFGTSRDYSYYESFFSTIINQGCEAGEEERFELGFQKISCMVGFIGNAAGMYAVQVFLSLLPKLLIIAFLSSGSWIRFVPTIVAYCFIFLPLHELTQIRASMSIAFFMIASILLMKIKWENLFKKDGIFAIMILILSCSIHNSSVILAPLVFLAKFSTSKRRIIVSSLLITVFLLLATPSFVEFNSTSILGIFYEKEGYGDALNFSNSQRALDIYLSFALLFIINNNNKDKMFLLSLFIYSSAIYYGCYQYPVYSSRLSEYLRVFSILLIATHTKNEKIYYFSWLLIAIIYSLWKLYTDQYFT
jgi:EpsG family